MVVNHGPTDLPDLTGMQILWDYVKDNIYSQSLAAEPDARNIKFVKTLQPVNTNNISHVWNELLWLPCC
jgi:hypothetical protein